MEPIVEHHLGKLPGEHIFKVPGGTVYFYTKNGYGQFKFVCGNKDHGSCVVSRQAHRNPNNLAQGRPVGLGLAFLQISDCFLTRRAHKEALLFDHGQRLEVRRDFAIDYPDVAAILLKKIDGLEAPPRDTDIDSEPEDQP